MTKLKFAIVAFDFFESLFTDEPTITGQYQWVRVFDGKAMMINTLEDLEQFDVVQVNMDSIDLAIIGELSKRLKGSSTVLVANQDYSPEIWKGTQVHPWNLAHFMRACDKVFATTPCAKACMEKIAPDVHTYLIPHPCETHVLKKFRARDRQDYVLVFWHRYDNEFYNPAVQLLGIDKRTLMAGFQPEHCQRMHLARSLYTQLIKYSSFTDFITLIKEAKYAFEPFQSFSIGRNTMDTACLGTPTVGNESLYSMRVCWPDLCCNPYDAPKVTKLFKALEDKSFYDYVVELAKWKVEFFGHKASRERYMAMLDGKDLVDPLEVMK